jgi:hypothetical protein
MPKFEVTLYHPPENDEYVAFYDDAIDWQDAWETAQMDFPDDEVVAVLEVTPEVTYHPIAPEDNIFRDILGKQYICFEVYKERKDK